MMCQKSIQFVGRVKKILCPTILPGVKSSLYTIILSLSTIIACAATYQPPGTDPTPHTFSIQSSKERLFVATKRAIIASGYSITDSDLQSGTISTAPKQSRLTESDCDCGTSMGIPYIKDKRTKTAVAINCTVDDSALTVRTAISGEYLSGDVAQGIAFECTSTGALEKKISAAVKSELRK